MSDTEAWPPPNDPAAFESLCLDLWKEIWGPESGAQKNGRSGQLQAGVDFFGKAGDRWIGVQCKQKDGLLRSRLTAAELDEEIRKVLGKEIKGKMSPAFDPPLSEFLVATTGPRDAEIQKAARKLAEGHGAGFSVAVWSWPDIWHEIYRRDKLLERIGPVYWPKLYEQTGRRRCAPSRLTHVPDRLFGRKRELARLDAVWRNPKRNVVTLVAWGGVGKTSLVARWAARLAERKHDGADFYDWSFYSQGTREEGAPSSDTFLSEALRFFGDSEMASGSAGPWEKGARLAQLVARRRTLLILDGLEPLQYPPSSPLAGQLKDQGVTALLKGLAANNPGLCLVTTRESIVDLSASRGSTAPEWELNRLATVDGVALLIYLGVKGSEKNLEKLVEDVAGHALTLSLLGTYLVKAHEGDVRRRDRVDLQNADLKTQGGHAFKTIAAYEKWLGGEREEGARQVEILRLLGLFDRPADRGCLAALRKEPAIKGLTDALMGIVEENWNLAVSALTDCHLVSRRDDGALDAHPLVREYFAKQLREKHEEAWRAAHGRLFEHLRDTTKPHQPDSLEGLQPLLQAVEHGCHAGRQQEAHDDVFYPRISRGKEAFVVSKLGAFGAALGALSCFFDHPWAKISETLTEGAQAWLLNATAFSLRALGRLTEAVEPMRATLEINESKGKSNNAAVVASNLSELELTLGEVSAAVADAERSVIFADRSGDWTQSLRWRSTHADALHQAGRREEARVLFREAERLQAKDQPGYPRLYSLQGFQYCDLLLGEAERAAGRGERSSVGAPAGFQLEEVEQRAAEAIKWELGMHGAPVLDFALHHLTLGRVALYRSILEGTAAVAARSEIEQAVDGLRRAGTQHMIPLGLLTRSWLRFAEGDEAGARADLAEAEEIASRGPMPLYLADVALYRGRMFKDRAALAEARRLIEKHGYRRRLGELEDAEAMMGERRPLPASG